MFEGSTGSAGTFNTLSRLTNSTLFDLEATGGDIWQGSDRGYFAYRNVTGNFEISASMTITGSGDGWAKVGLMVRESINHKAINIFASYADSHGSTVQKRLNNTCADDDNSCTTSISDSNRSNRFAKLIRSGNKITAFKSANGYDWEYVDETNVSALGGDVLVGFAATSHNSSNRQFVIEEIKFTSDVSLY